MILKFLHITLAFLVFLSSTGVTINSHYCMDELKDLSIFLPAKSCCGERHQELQENLCDQKHKQLSQRKCCRDNTDYFSVDLSGQQVLDAEFSGSNPFFANLPLAKVVWLELIWHPSFIMENDAAHSALFPVPLPPRQPIFLLVQSFLC